LPQRHKAIPNPIGVESYNNYNAISQRHSHLPGITKTNGKLTLN
jgi:hypothetical protein